MEIERIKALILARLSAMIEANETRIDLKEKFESMIAAYNSGSMQIQHLFEELLNFSQGLDEEATRHVREQLTEEELVVFDLLTRPGPDLTAKERDKVKAVAREMLAKVQQAFSASTGAKLCSPRQRSAMPSRMPWTMGYLTPTPGTSSR